MTRKPADQYAPFPVVEPVQTLTEPQTQTLDAVRALLDKGYSPTVREVAAVSGASLATAQHRLTRLRVLGYVTWIPGRMRTIRLTEGSK